MNWPYIAGILDGEGTIGAYTDSYHRMPQVQLIVENTDEALVDYLVSSLGGIKVSGPKAKRNPNWKQTYRWIMTARGSIRTILSELQPYLIVKLEQARIMLELLTCMKGKGVRVSDQLYLKAYELTARLQKLNKRGSEESIC